MTALAEFQALIADRLLPEFCQDAARGYPLDAYRGSSLPVHEVDAKNFCRAWDAGLIKHLGRGLYRSPMSNASEQFFWTSKASGSVTFTLWLEPVITVATLARLHFEFGWPAHLIGTQSKDWAFDVVAHRASTSAEAIACEVKKTESEVVTLIAYMQQFGREQREPDTPLKSKALNAAKKVQALRLRQAPTFWAVGPGGLSRVFEAGYGDGGAVHFAESSEASLRY